MADRPPPDISLAVHDGARRLSYVELAAVRGISRGSAERLVRRRHWPRQLGNDGVVRVLVPLTEAMPETAGRGKRIPPDGPPPVTPPVPGPDIPRIVREAMESVVAPLAKQLEHETQRADHERSRADDAVAAERIAAGEASALRAELDRRRDWGLVRRLRWALRGDRDDRYDAP
jgi:hypothetical protein